MCCQWIYSGRHSWGVCQLFHPETAAVVCQHSTNEVCQIFEWILWIFIFFSCLFEMEKPLPVINTDVLLIFPPGCGTKGTSWSYGTNTSGILGILWVCFSSGVAACSEKHTPLTFSPLPNRDHQENKGREEIEERRGRRWAWLPVRLSVALQAPLVIFSRRANISNTN